MKKISIFIILCYIISRGVIVKAETPLDIYPREIGAVLWDVIPTFTGDSYTKLQKINRHIIDTYDYDYGYTNYTAWRGYLTGKITCSGYTEIFMYNCIKNDIPCQCVHSETHAWNIVQVEGKWYYIDSTWNDTARNKGGTGEEYFLKGTNSFDQEGEHLCIDCEEFVQEEDYRKKVKEHGGSVHVQKRRTADHP